MNITTGKGDIRVAIVGVGNCANSLVQALRITRMQRSTKRFQV